METRRVELEMLSSDADYHTGMEVHGAFCCTDCSYGITIYRRLPACPMCGSSSWSAVPAQRIESRFPGGPGNSPSDDERRAA